MRRPVRLAAVAAAGVFAAGCGKPEPDLPPPEPPAVTVEHPVERVLDSFTEFTGRLEAVETQEVRAQVTGYLKAVKFEEGGLVREGQELYEIDPEPYDAALNSAKAAHERALADQANAQAQLKSAQADLDRIETVRRSGGGAAMSQEEADKRKASRDSADAALKSARAAIAAAAASRERAEFDRRNCVVRSDVKGVGRADRTRVTKGNLIVSGQTVLCRVTSVDPIYALWDVDEITSLAYGRAVFDKKELADPRAKGNRLKCWVGLKDEAGFPHPGEVDYIGPEIVRGTGAREVRGVFPNPGYRYTPGNSVRVKVEAGPPRKLLTVPEVAVSSQQRQKYVYVVAKGENGAEVAEFRPVALGPVREVNGARLQVIEAGVTPADRVVVNGLMRVRPGLPLAPKLQPSPVPAGPPTQTAAR